MHRNLNSSDSLVRVHPTLPVRRHSHSLLKSLLIVALLFGFFIAILPSARALAPYQAIWNTTAGWNSGSKADLDTATDSCLAQGNGLQLNATGGFYGVSNRCPSGIPDSPSPRIALDMSTRAENGQLKDFGPKGDFNTTTGISVVAGKFGNAVQMPSISVSGETIINPPEWFLSAGTFTWVPTSTTKKLTVLMWIKPTIWNATTGVKTLFTDSSQSGTVGFLWVYFDAGTTRTLTMQYANGATTPSPTFGTVSSDTSSYHALVIELNYTAGQQAGMAWYDGAYVGKATMTNALDPLAKQRALYIGSYAPTGSNTFMGSFDEFVAWDSWLPLNEVLAISSQGAYANFGSWSIYGINVTDATPTHIILGWSNVSGTDGIHPEIAGFSVWEDSGCCQFDSPSFYTETGNISQLNFTATVSGNSSWNIEVDLMGNGTNTAQLSFVAITFTGLAVAAPTLDTNAMIFIAGLVLMLALGLGGLMIQDGIPALSIFGGLVGVMFGFWLWTQTAQPWLLLILVFLGILFMFMGAFMAFQDAGGG